MVFARYSLPISVILISIILSGCISQQRSAYKDKFPEPCTAAWYVEIEREVELINSDTGRPRAGSPQWLAALDEKYLIAKKSTTQVGDFEWCHQVHQRFIGL